MKVLLAGASGAVGAPLTRQLLAAGHQVVGITRSTANAERLRNAGAEAVVADVTGVVLLGQAHGFERPAILAGGVLLLLLGFVAFSYATRAIPAVGAHPESETTNFRDFWNLRDGVSQRRPFARPPFQERLPASPAMPVPLSPTQPHSAKGA